MPGLLLSKFSFVLVQYECENVLNDAALMEACGVGLSRTDMYGVMMVCKQLGEDPKLGVATVRFFGKVVIQDTSSNDRQLSCTCLLFGVWYLPSLSPIQSHAITAPLTSHNALSAVLAGIKFCCTNQAREQYFLSLLAAAAIISKLAAGFDSAYGE